MNYDAHWASFHAPTSQSSLSGTREANRMPFICSEFPQDVYATYAEAEQETAIEYGVSYINGDCGYIEEVPADATARDEEEA